MQRRQFIQLAASAAALPAALSFGGRVFAAPGFADAYRRYIEGGWTSLNAPVEFGGQGLPRSIALVVSSRLATLHELQTVYGAVDLYDFLEVLAVDGNNARARRRKANPRG